MRSLRACIAVALVTAAACGSAPPEAREAQRLLRAGAYAPAEAAADRGLRRHPDEPTLWRAKIHAIMGQLDPDRAVALYSRWFEARGRHDGATLERMALTTLWQGLRVPSARIRVQAIQAIERLELEALARDVIERVNDDDDAVAAAAAVAVLRSQPGAPRAAAQLLRSEDAEARAIVVEGVGRKLEAKARDDLVRALGDRDARVRRAAAAAVGALGQAADMPRLGDVATGDADGAVRAAALSALAGAGREARASALAAAAQALGDEAVDVRLAAVDVAAAHRDPALLERAARAGELRVALRALVALRGVAQARAALAQGLAHPAPDTRVAALEAAAALVPAGEARALAGARLDDDSEHVRVAAGAVLARLGDPRGAGALSVLCSADDADVREAAVRAHAHTRVLSAGLIAALADESALIRVLAAETLLGVRR